MDKQNTYLKQTYDIAQVGYDKKKRKLDHRGGPGLRNREGHLYQRNRKREAGKPCPVRNHAERRRAVHRRHPERKPYQERLHRIQRNEPPPGREVQDKRPVAEHGIREADEERKRLLHRPEH